MANTGAHVISDTNVLQSASNTVYLIPANGQSISKEEIVSLLAGLPQLTRSQVTNRQSASKSSSVPAISVSNNFQVPPTPVTSSVMVEEPITFNKTADSSSMLFDNSFLTTQIDMPASGSKVIPLTCTNQVLSPISPNILTPDASPILATQTTPTVTPIRVKIYPKACPVTPTTPNLAKSSNGLPTTPVTSKQQTAVKNVDLSGTLVFFDLETTGLAHMIGKSNVQITEISMIALDKKEFWQSKNSELKDIRIMQKLSMCIRPRTGVSPGAAKITGLDNDNLVDQCPFDRNVGTAITSFLSHLPKPVCLLAHNGNVFDFPLLKAELKRLSMQLPSDLLVADTLLAFKSIGIAESPPDRKICKSVKYGRSGRLSHSLENLHLFFFNKKPTGGHSSEGDCVALAKVCHKLKDEAIPWIEANARTLDTVQPMW